MVIMDKNCFGEGDPVFDLESGVNSVNKEQQEAKDTVFSAGQDKGVLGRVWNGFVAISGSIKGERSVKLYHSTSNTVELPLTKEEALVDKRLGQEAKVGLSEKKIGVEKTKKKGCKKPPKPPRPPNSPPLDAADQKLMKEIAEVALMKRARIERMKKKMKNAKLTHSNGNFWAFIITILFVIVIIWQGVISRGSSNFSFHGSPESSVRARGGFISIQFYKNASKNVLHASTSASPNNVSG
ncbi:uncharacterized protein LOC103976136 [Musa acuminata AAA Group]|uniref:uncharacterized protein LOC103976136 n=1 Tax=Musa acuminata AAA Group TaxID=214697 RepID=UPI0031D4D1E9